VFCDVAATAVAVETGVQTLNGWNIGVEEG
jgi:hypothetical protein